MKYRRWVIVVLLLLSTIIAEQTRSQGDGFVPVICNKNIVIVDFINPLRNSIPTAACNTVLTSLEISGCEATNPAINCKVPAFVSGIVYVNSGVKIFGHKTAKSLSMLGLGSLEFIRGDIRIEKNLAMTSLDRLNNIRFLEGSLIVREMPELTLISAPSLVQLNNLQIFDCPSLKSLQNSFSSLTVLFGNLDVSKTGLSSMKGLDNVQILNSLTITENNAMKTLTGLGGIARVGGNVVITKNSVLEELEPAIFQPVINGTILLQSLPSLLSLEALGSLVKITGPDAGDALIISKLGPNIVNFQGIDNLLEIYGNLRIEENEGLLNLNGFNALEKILGTIYILNNPNLETLTGMSSLLSIESPLKGVKSEIYIENNPSLLNIDGFESLGEVQQLFINAPNALSITLGGTSRMGRPVVNLVPLVSSIGAKSARVFLKRVCPRDSIIKPTGCRVRRRRRRNG